eukprot:7388262-Prymnesium_polylepis.2
MPLACKPFNSWAAQSTFRPRPWRSVVKYCRSASSQSGAGIEAASVDVAASGSSSCGEERGGGHTGDGGDGSVPV